uniref:Uncharacterized protein n=1 Tax=Anguilla anguilla TaxID=7936 RepID=A0A0E9Q1V4_ANGAN
MKLCGQFTFYFFFFTKYILLSSSLHLILTQGCVCTCDFCT